jgi:hypothetical protein
MNFKRMAQSAVIVTSLFLGLAPRPVRAQGATSTPTAQPSPVPNGTVKVKVEVPAYHTAPSKAPLPATLDPKLFSDAETQNIYALAAKEKDVLYQLPCYCRCDKEVGHKSLLDCYVEYHAAHCVLCKKEAAFAYTETKAGKTVDQIRKEIMDGKWQDVDLSKYDTLPVE